MLDEQYAMHSTMKQRKKSASEKRTTYSVVVCVVRTAQNSDEESMADVQPVLGAPSGAVDLLHVVGLYFQTYYKKECVLQKYNM